MKGAPLIEDNRISMTILRDIQLPDIEGFEVLQRLLKIESTKNIPVITATSSSVAGSRQRLLAAGCRGYIEKPVDSMRIIEQIKQYHERLK